MSKIKNFDRALYNSDFEAVTGFIKEGYLPNYDFNVSAAWAFENVLSYLCLNGIPHYYTINHAHSFSLITIVFGKDESFSYSFLSEYKGR